VTVETQLWSNFQKLALPPASPTVHTEHFHIATASQDDCVNHLRVYLRIDSGDNMLLATVSHQGGTVHMLPTLVVPPELLGCA